MFWPSTGTRWRLRVVLRYSASMAAALGATGGSTWAAFTHSRGAWKNLTCPLRSVVSMRNLKTSPDSSVGQIHLPVSPGGSLCSGGFRFGVRVGEHPDRRVGPVEVVEAADRFGDHHVEPLAEAGHRIGDALDHPLGLLDEGRLVAEAVEVAGVGELHELVATHRQRCAPSPPR